MAEYKKLEKRTIGAWVIHHGQKTTATTTGAAEFAAIDAAGKAASLLSQLSHSEQSIVERKRVETLAKAAGLNPKVELSSLLEMLEKQRVISRSKSGDVEILGLTTHATTAHAADLFEDQAPTSEERATIFAAEIASKAPIQEKSLIEQISDEFKLTKDNSTELLHQSEKIGFIDAEGKGSDKLIFNGHLFRRDHLKKTEKILNSLSREEEEKVRRLSSILDKKGCVIVTEAETVLGEMLFQKLQAAGMYDVNSVINPSGTFAFVTRPSAFHKFNDPMADDSFDLAKALVAALFYGMTQSSSGRGKIEMITALVKKLVAGREVGPATAIGEDYRVLETKGVIRVRPGESYGHYMRLLKKDVGQMALDVLTTGQVSTSVAIDNPLPGKMTGFTGPEKARTELRKRQISPSRKHTHDLLQVLRTTGGISG